MRDPIHVPPQFPFHLLKSRATSVPALPSRVQWKLPIRIDRLLFYCNGLKAKRPRLPNWQDPPPKNRASAAQVSKDPHPLQASHSECEWLRWLRALSYQADQPQSDGRNARDAAVRDQAHQAGWLLRLK